ncbi:trigger factor [Arthrobacter castelli]|uniref:trigger factor n=1 Tax=Arthrobacter castelli TaxID=271431 RepID=UPI000403A218|nr:trigger factor [Arthrobacter castelli]
MKSAVENLNPTRVKLKVEVPFEELKPQIDEAYKTVSSQIQVPGFRKGKVPNKLIDQRVGRAYIIESAVNEGLNGYYQAAVQETEISPLSQPEVEITSIPDPESFEGDLNFEVEVDIRPDVELPDYSGIEVTVEPAKSSDEDVDKELDELRGRFGTLKNVDRPAVKDDFLTLDLSAKIGDEEVDSASDLSYQVGAGTMLDGMDEAVEGLSADESAIFETKLSGGDHSGEDAQVTVVVKAVKERELPEPNDDFAQLASEFDTIEELRADLENKAGESKVVDQGVEARDKVLEQLVGMIDVPVPQSVIDQQVEQHFNQENQEEDHDTEEHREEVAGNAEHSFRNEVILDAVADKEEVGVEQNELIDYIVSTASQYGMDPNQFAQIIDQSGQVPMMVSEVRRRKALALVLGQATVTDTEGAEVDLTEFVRPASETQGAEAAEQAAEAEGAAAEGAAAEDGESSHDAAVSADDPGAARF